MKAQVLASLAMGLLFALAGCGGNTGADSPGSDSSSGRDACPLTKYASNYAGPISLAYWPNFPLNVYFDTTSTSYTSTLQAQSVAAFNTWVDQTGNQVAYNVVGSESAADISVGYLPLTDPLLANYHADGITYFSAGESSASAPADARYQSVRIYIGIDGATTRQIGTMAHEFGHALGIHGHSADSNDLMYYVWLPTRSQEPTTRDVNTLYTAYCGIFPTSTTATGKNEPTVTRRGAMPPITAPGWVAMP